MTRPNGTVPDGGSTSLAEAISILGTHLGPIDRTEAVPIQEATGRVLANPIVAEQDQPHYRRAERDGFAVRTGDTTDASAESPVGLSIADETVGAGETLPVHTGSAVPAGADAVVMIEDVEETVEGIEVSEPVESGTSVTPIGAELEAGTHLYESGHRLRPGDLGTLKVAGVRTVSVVESPTVAVIPTGEELVQEAPGPGEVVETNGLVGSQLVTHWGGTARYRDVVTDDETELRAAIEQDLDADLLVTTGGSSVGARDLLPKVVGDRGEVLVRGLALRPGHSASLGVVSGTPIAMLPGTPIASLVVAWLLVRPALAKSVGASVVDPPTVQATLKAGLESEPGRRSVHGVTLEEADGENGDPTARPAPRGGLPALARIDGWVQVPASRAHVGAEKTVQVERWGLSC